MKINRDNYEAYLLDLLEGRLSAQDQQVVSNFLLLNPDCAIGIEDTAPWILEKESISFPTKELLKKEIPNASFILTESNFDLFSIGRMEGDLTGEQENDHASVVEGNEAKRKEWADWQKTKLSAKPIIFKSKDQLKHKKGISRRVIWMSVISSAAVTALLITLLRIDPVTPDSEFAMKTEPPHSVEKVQRKPGQSDPLPQPEIAVVIPRIESGLPEDKPAFFSIKKNTERQEESLINGDNKNAEPKKDTIDQVLTEEVPHRPVRIASYESFKTDLLNEGAYDHIKPLDIPPASIHLSSLSISQIAEVDLQEIFDDYTSENEISLWTIANAGIRGINRLTGADMSLLAARDDEGDVSGFRFKSKRFSLASPLEQSE